MLFRSKIQPCNCFFEEVNKNYWFFPNTIDPSVFKKNEDIESFREVRKYSRYMKQLEEQGLSEAADSYNFNIVTITPYKIRRLCYREGLRNVIWKSGE